MTRLPDGRYVAARLDMPFGPGRGNWLRYLALVAAVAGLAAYPVVRHLTRRLEGLRRGVEAWGAGALDRRVAVEGKDEVAAVAATFNQAADRIERLVEAHRSLLANASHELRSPLARLRIAIDLYELSASEERKREIVRNLGELDGLVEEILLASRLDHNDRLDPVEAVDLLALTAEEGARNGVAVNGQPATVLGDPRLLTRLVRNLMQNALRHGAPPVTAELKSANGTVELRIRDHGPGIPAGESERVFEPFYRPSGRGETAGGWGLGLSLVRQIARHHKASVRIRDAGRRRRLLRRRFPEGCVLVSVANSKFASPWSSDGGDDSHRQPAEPHGQQGAVVHRAPGFLDIALKPARTSVDRNSRRQDAGRQRRNAGAGRNHRQACGGKRRGRHRHRRPQCGARRGGEPAS